LGTILSILEKQGYFIQPFIISRAESFFNGVHQILADGHGKDMDKFIEQRIPKRKGLRVDTVVDFIGKASIEIEHSKKEVKQMI
jgi:hypothetical protein